MTRELLIGFAAVVLAAKGTGGPSTAEEYMTLAHVELSAGDPVLAEKTLREGMKRFSDTGGFHLLLGHVYARRSRFADAFFEYQWEILRSGADQETGRAAEQAAEQILHQARGPEADEVRRAVTALSKPPQDALADLSKLDRERPGTFVLRLWLADQRTRTGDHGGAAALLRELISQDPYFVPAYVSLARLPGTPPPEAQKLLARARKIDPQHWSLR